MPGIMSRLFTVPEAESLLPEIESTVREALSLKAAYQQAERRLQETTRRIAMLGGTLVNPQPLMADRSRIDSTTSALSQVIEKIHGYGCLVKDLDIGLVDFPTLFRGEEVYLCWKLGEGGIRFWHGVHEGFQGRKPIDRDFLEHHRGEAAN